MTKPFKPGHGAIVQHRGYKAVVVAQSYYADLCCLRWVDALGAIWYEHGVEVVDDEA